jgi:hypothetical protein
MGDRRKLAMFWLINLSERDNVEVTGVDGGIILK